jgi:hypothetical protein
VLSQNSAEKLLWLDHEITRNSSCVRVWRSVGCWLVEQFSRPPTEEAVRLHPLLQLSRQRVHLVLLPPRRHVIYHVMQHPCTRARLVQSSILQMKLELTCCNTYRQWAWRRWPSVPSSPRRSRGTSPCSTSVGHTFIFFVCLLGLGQRYKITGGGANGATRTW